MKVKDEGVEEQTRISEGKLRLVAQCIDRLVEWATETLETIQDSILKWAVSSSAGAQYGSEVLNTWKQFICYAFRSALIDEDARGRAYGIEFIPEQVCLIHEIVELLKDHDDDDEYLSDEGDEDYEDGSNDNNNYEFDDEDKFDDNYTEDDMREEGEGSYDDTFLSYHWGSTWKRGGLRQLAIQLKPHY